jgi:P pilus assembly chaperone PapD
MTILPFRITALACLLSGGVAAAAAAQTISPLVAEYQREARGRVEIRNNGDQPLQVVIEPRGFTVGEDGQILDQPLSPQVHVTLSAMSFRLPPRQSRFVFYHATAEQAPSWFILYANLSGYPQRAESGINVQLELPHVVYILPRETWQSADVKVIESTYNRETRRVELLVENEGALFGRIAEVQVAGGGRRVTAPGFPLFPGARRRVDVEWPTDGPPDTVQLTAPNVSVRHRVEPVAR